MKEKSHYGIYNPIKEIELAIRLPGLQNVFRAKLMAIHQTFQKINNKFPNEPTYIFADCLNDLYIIKTQIKHPLQHNNHPDKNYTRRNSRNVTKKNPTYNNVQSQSTCKH